MTRVGRWNVILPNMKYLFSFNQPYSRNTKRYPLYQFVSLYSYHVQSQDCNITVLSTDIWIVYQKWKLNSKTICRCAVYRLPVVCWFLFPNSWDELDDIFSIKILWNVEVSFLLPFLHILVTKIVLMMNICYSMYHLYCIFFIYLCKIVYHCNINLYHIWGPHGRLVPLFAKCC